MRSPARPSSPPRGPLLRGALLAAAVLAGAAAGPAWAAGSAEAGRIGSEDGVSAERAAAAVDRAVARLLADEGLSPAPAAEDDDLLRRLTLDIAGRLPTPEEQAKFAALSGSPLERRAAAVDHLLADDGYADNWAAYWRDVIFKRATDTRAARADHVFQGWVRDRLASGAGWDEIATDLLTATGKVGQDGATGLIFAQSASGGEVAAEASRIFLGIQIQCAECHDHPYDRWKREDFHALAAYFPRIRLRRVDLPPDPDAKGKAKTQQRRYFEIASVDTAGGDREQAQKAVKRLREALVRKFRFVDKDKDGGLSVEELKNTPAKRQAERILQFADADGNGKLSVTEVRKLNVPPALLSGSRAGEHLMPDLENPEEPGTLVDPRFFLTDQQLKGGMPDDRRRKAAASLITLNEWFAKAAVNRVFTQLVGDGFYTPVDDIGPDRSVRLEGALEALAKGFEENDHDLRWLVRAITLTDLYGRAIDAEAAPFVAARPARLRAHQIFHSVAHVAGGGDHDLGVERLSGKNPRPRQGPYGTMPDTRPAAARALEGVFGYDPSTDREELNGDVPQALALMNGQLTARLSAANGPLGRVLFENPSDAHAVRALYRLILVRDPTAAEREIAVAHLVSAPTRQAGFEDLAWALMNGAEFVTKR